MSSTFWKFGGTLDVQTFTELQSLAKKALGYPEPRNCAERAASFYLTGLDYNEFLDNRNTSHFSAKDYGRKFRQRAPLIGRAFDLLPSILSCLKCDLVKQRYESADRVLEVAFECQEQAAQKSRKAQRTRTYESVDSLLATLEKLKNQIEIIDNDTISELCSFMGKVNIEEPFEYPEFKKIFQFGDEIHLYMELIQAWRRFDIELQSRSESPGTKRFEFVRQVHRLCKKFDGPEPKTTPNSEFSDLTAWIYELATGVPDVSSPGAISRYARSKYRKMVEDFADGDMGLPDRIMEDHWIRNVESLDAAMKHTENSGLTAKILKHALATENEKLKWFREKKKVNSSN